jgi:glycine cleavage system H protein
MKVLKSLLYTREHVWVKVDGDEAYLGITDFAQKALGSIVYVEVSEADTECTVGDNFGTVESDRDSSDLFIPIDGKVTEVNEEVVDDPALINKNPYENWLVRIEIDDKAQLEDLLSAEEYKEFCLEEE